MKNIVLCGISARYSHSSLALLCLSACTDVPVRRAEFTINDRTARIVDALARMRPDAVGFSCYIWNIAQVLQTASSLKKILPECFILLGGPEVSFDAPALMEAHPFIGMIVCGPGETPFAYFAKRFASGRDVKDTPSACVRTPDGLAMNAAAPPFDLNRLRFMYDDLTAFSHRTIYYETSRGCPFGCAYCMSARERMSYLPLARVHDELAHFIRADVRQVKLVDRTFNHPPERGREILRMLLALSAQYPQSCTRFHLEISAYLLDDETLALLARAKPGLIQLEVGIQSTHAETLRAVHRTHDIQAVLRNTERLCAMPNLRVHADLIAGLPFEDYETFGRSFNDVYRLRPAALQLGFLKVLKGAPIRKLALKYRIAYTDYAPYEVLSTHVLPYESLSRLHRIAALTDALYNSGHFAMTLDCLLPASPSPFALFEALADYLDAHEWFARPHKPPALYTLLYDFSGKDPRVREALQYDWACLARPGAWPEGLAPEPEGLPLPGPEVLAAHLPDSEGLPAAALRRRCCLIAFPRLFAPPAVVLFDYSLPRTHADFARVVPLP